jgi:hypothetical protein
MAINVMQGLTAGVTSIGGRRHYRVLLEVPGGVRRLQRTGCWLSQTATTASRPITDRISYTSNRTPTNA